MSRLSLSSHWRVACRLLLAVLLGVFGSVDVARAHPELDRAKRLASELEFDAALAAFDAALVSGELTREELIELLGERSLVLHALHRKNDLVRDFVWLSALAPDYRLDLRAAPDLTALWNSVRDQGRGALKVELQAESGAPGELDARATLSGTVPEGARARLWIRRGTGGFEALLLSELHETLPKGGTVELYAQATGLGGVVIAQDYAAADPLRVTVAARRHEPNDPVDGSPSWARRHRGWLIGGAAAVVVAAAVVTGVLIAGKNDGQSDKTTLTPMVTF